MITGISDFLAHKVVLPFGRLVAAAAGLETGDYERHGCCGDFVSWFDLKMCSRSTVLCGRVGRG